MKMMAKAFDELLTEEELRDAFRVFDADNRGTITAFELRQVIIKLGIPMSELEIIEMIKSADSSGQVQYSEFVEMILRKLFDSMSSEFIT